MKEKKVFRSRISVLLLGFILAIFIPSTIPMIKHLIISGLLVVGGTLLFIAFLFNGIRYIFRATHCTLRYGTFPAEV